MEQEEKQNINNNPELTREDKLELEERAIQALIDMGVKFSVPLKIKPRKQPKRIQWWNKHFPNNPIIWRDRRIPADWDVSVEDIPDTAMRKVEPVYMRHFHVKPLYLGTIDYIRKLYINIEYDEESIQNQPIQETKKLFKYIPLVAEIAAVAVINDPCITNPKDPRVKELKRFFIEHLNVKRLKRLADVISQMMNAGGFTSSIRSIREIGQTKPMPRENLIETNEKSQA